MENLISFTDFCNENKSFRFNKKFGDSLEVIFDSKPAVEVLTKLKDAGFKWSMMNKLWYKSQPTEEDKELAKELTKFLIKESIGTYYTFEGELTIDCPELSDKIYKIIDDYIYHSFSSAFSEVESRFGIDLNWLETNIEDYCNDNEEDFKEYIRNQRDRNFEKKPTDEEKFQFYMDDTKNYKEFQELIENEGFSLQDIDSEIQDKIEKRLIKEYNEDDLAQYFDSGDYVESMKIIEVDSYGRFTIEVKTNRNLTDEEINVVKDYLDGQNSDGFGESFEQHEIGGYSVHMWQSGKSMTYKSYKEQEDEDKEINKYSNENIPVENIPLGARPEAEEKLKSLMGEYEDRINKLLEDNPELKKSYDEIMKKKGF